ncbi:DUF1837 domain-containing protein [Geodermatophilus sp. DSM 45219]|uniref:HamA C-terminal domain-containing protein n=1 Tax=Geodermatophilus sp. DSM 45219 TaxID=1881103 RepID=UPI00088374DB|nr:DUF1837 domain-containing protein [Geodermatophilus sp. DSM 45219]SDN83138.1 protein of unknown function [Geodermatophilus sp. DSM 45219]
MPDPFLEVLVNDLDLDPTLTALCACYELGTWRTEQYARHLFEWLPEFALTWAERQSFSDATAVVLLRRAAAVVYSSDKYSKRGEFGELILHAIIRQVFGTEPAISKLYFKDAANNTVKGFDAVHIVEADGVLELWLGEAKLYSSVSQAIAAVVSELHEHTDADYLRQEFTLIANKIDASWPHAHKVKSLLNPNTSLDTVFARLTIPVLLTYDSPTTQAHTKHTDDYALALEEEVRGHWATFSAKNLPAEVRVRLFLLPLPDKAGLVKVLHNQLMLWQNI